MPGPLVAFFILIGLGSASALKGPPAVWSRVDPTAHSSGHLAPARPWAWTAPQWDGIARQNHTCPVVVFGASPRPVRFRVGTQEQNLDTGWAVDLVAKENHKLRIPYTFLEPVGGAVISEGVLNVNC